MLIVHSKLSQAIKQNITEVKEDMRKVQKGKEVDSFIIVLDMLVLNVYALDQETQNIINWISPLNFPIKQNDYFSRRHTGTGEWLLEDTTFKSWLDGPEKTLWCPGIRTRSPLVYDYIISTY